MYIYMYTDIYRCIYVYIYIYTYICVCESVNMYYIYTLGISLSSFDFCSSETPDKTTSSMDASRSSFSFWQPPQKENVVNNTSLCFLSSLVWVTKAIWIMCICVCGACLRSGVRVCARVCVQVGLCPGVWHNLFSHVTWIIHIRKDIVIWCM